MLKGKRKFLIFGLCALVVAAIVGFMITQQGGEPKLFHRATGKSVAAQPSIVDQSAYRTALGLQPLASTEDEQELAIEAIHISDREVDIAFASALNRAKAAPPAQTKDTTEINRRLKLLQNRLQNEQAEVDRLTKLVANPGKYDATVLHQQLEIGQAQISVLQDALDDAKEDLVRAGGDPEAVIQDEIEEHENLQHGNGGTPASPRSKPENFEVEGSLVSQFRTWQRLRKSEAQLLAARQEASNAVSTLTKKHEALEKGLSDSIALGDTVADQTAAPDAPVADQTQHADKLAKLNKLSQNTKTLSSYDKRIDLEKQLAEIYGDWAAIVGSQIRLAMHAILRSLLWILLALLGLVVVEGAIEHFFLGLGPDRRRLGTTRLALRFVTQLIGVLIILLVLFGPPSQLSTILALAGAGLTVALKDFIVAFFGWFVLMGHNGIRVGDWVEINGIGGEVMEIGLLRTILLETGNWNDAGHPTGRRVSFVNSFAVEGHYFNFTTAGQWLWDELDILIPAAEDPYELTKSVLKLVTEKTRDDAALAEQEWQRVTHNSAVQSFSAAPAINVRPTNLGVNLVVRYVVNAHSRYQVRTRLYEAIVEMMHSQKVARSTAGS
jgi:small-conductance mechanosensitive channel